LALETITLGLKKQPGQWSCIRIWNRFNTFCSIRYA